MDCAKASHRAVAIQPDRGWSGAQKLLLATIMGINILEGMDNQLLALLLPAIAQQWGISPASFAPAMTAGFIGAAIATPIGGWLGDRFGRKPIVVSGLGLFACMTTGMGFCHNVEELTVLRALAGLGLGLCLPPSLALAVESVRPEQRATAVALTMFSLPLGLALSGLVGPAMVALHGWAATFRLCGVAGVIGTLLALLLLRESPSFLLRRPMRRSEALQRAQVLGVEVEQDSGGQRSASGSGLAALRRQTVLLGLLVATIFLIYLIMSIVLSWLPSFLAERGLTLSRSGMVLSSWSLAGLAGTLVAGGIAGRIGSIRGLRVILLMLNLSLFVGLAASFWRDVDGHASLLALCLLVGLVGMQVSGCITAIYAVASDQIAAAVRSTGIGFLSLSGKLGAILGSASGALILATGSTAALCGGLLAIAMLAWLLSRIAEHYSGR